MQFKGEALNWWVRQQNTPTNDDWDTMSETLLEYYLPINFEEARGNLYLARWAGWLKNAERSMEEYIARFRAKIISITPLDESPRDLIWLFWKELPAVMKGLLESPRAWTL